MGYMLCLIVLLVDLAIMVVGLCELIRRGGWNR